MPSVEHRRELLVIWDRHRAMEVLGAETLLHGGEILRAQQRLVERDGRTVVLHLRQRVEHDLFGGRGEHRLIRAIDRKPRERVSDVRAEFERDDLVAAGQERDEPAVTIGSEARRELRIAWSSEDVQSRRLTT